MGWRLAADVVLVSHLLFIVFIVVGGFWARRHRWIQRLHAATAIYGAAILVIGFTCPLTPLEKWLRAEAGQAGYEGGFVEHYIVGVIYPGELDAGVRFLLMVAIGAAIVAAYVPWRQAPGRRPLGAKR